MNTNMNVPDIDCLAEKLRRENYEQFNILVRMHLSFVLDLNTDDSEAFAERGKLKKWSFVPFNKKLKVNRGIMDGIPLTQEGICQVYQLIEFLKKEPNISTEGIFRRTGSLARQQELRGLLNQGITVSLENNIYSVHDCASVLKGFLAELPEPLLTDAHYPAHCQIAELCGVYEKSTKESQLLDALQLLLLLLPSENRILLKDVLDLLHLTASYESSNKMSADSLATLFTPHLLCPRNLSPEGLHLNSQTLSGVVSFMIKKSSELFQIPPKLAIDIRAHYSERERRKMLSPKRNFNESVSDNFAANTVYSFVDVVRTAKENQSNPTETALAQLYAYIQGLPESSKKRKLVKQFNKENGHGTPLQLVRINAPKNNKSLGSSIKKHIFHKSLTKAAKKSAFSQQRASSVELLNSPLLGLTSRAKLFCTKCDTSTDASNDENITKKFKKSHLSSENLKADTLESTINEIKRCASDPNLSTDNTERVHNLYLTSTPAYVPQCVCPDVTFTPQDQSRKSMSPITRSTQRMSKAMQETMMTPRSRKPVLLISGTNISNLPKLEIKDCNMDSVDEESIEVNSNIKLNSLRRSRSLGSLKEQEESGNLENTDPLASTFREYLHSRSILLATPTDLSFSSCTDDYCSAEISTSQMSSSLLHCLNGFTPPAPSSVENSSISSSNCGNKDSDTEKELVLRPTQFDDDGKPIVYETSF